jgi:MYXO-CTERM domain-containing protein
MSKFLKIAAIGCVLSMLSAGQAFAVPVFQSSVDATLSLTGVTVIEGTGDLDVTVDGDALVTDSDSFFDGAAVGDLTATASPPALTPLADAPIEIFLNGTGEVPGIGDAFAFAGAESLIMFNNNSETNAVRLDFMLDYSLTSLAEVDDPDEQSAMSEVYFRLENSQEQDLIADFFFAAVSGTPETAFSISDVLQFSVFLSPTGGSTLTLLSSIFGTAGSNVEPALSDVPIPSMAGLFALAAFLGLRRRRAAQS